MSKKHGLPHVFARSKTLYKQKSLYSPNSHTSTKQRYKDSNLEMTESESVALPFGDSAKMNIVNYNR